MSYQSISTSIAVSKHQLALTVPLSFLPGDRTQREIAILTLRDGSGKAYHGEVAPLPGYFTECLDDALNEFQRVRGNIPPLAGELLPLPVNWQNFLTSITSPALRCGLEGALLDYAADKGQLTLRRDTVECNALLLEGSPDEMQRNFEELCGRGFKTLKLKISPKSISATTATLHSLNFPQDVRLRFDGNRSFSRDEWLRAANSLEGLPIEYVEEPIAAPEHLPEIIKRSPIPIALDETTRDSNIAEDEWLRWGGAAVVLKPALNGGLLSLLPLIAQIEDRGAYVTLSSSFESSVGLRSLTLLALLLNRCGAVGVDTAKYIREESDLMHPLFPRSTPSITMKQLSEMQYAGPG